MNFEQLQTIKTIETAIKQHGQGKKNDSSVSKGQEIGVLHLEQTL